MYNRLRLILPLIVSVALGSVLFAAYQVRTADNTLRNDLNTRAAVMADSLQQNLNALMERHAENREIARTIQTFGRREHVAAIGVLDANGSSIGATEGFPDELWRRPEVARAGEAGSHFVSMSAGLRHLYVLPLEAGTLVLLQDATYIQVQTARMWRDALLNATIQTVLIGLLGMFIFRWNLNEPIARTTRWLRSLRHGEASPNTFPGLPIGEEFEELTAEVTHLARNLGEARAAAETEARLRDSAESLWTAERLRVSVRNRMQSCPLFVVANREPYMHVHQDRRIQVVVPASGLVTALEPVLVACDGTWIAHGGGDADRETTDANDRLRVPPDAPRYTLRRVWLDKAEEDGYYFGFSNEGLWPLCHTAYVRPIFRPEDWLAYQEVNQKFADAALAEMPTSGTPILLAQDYHFALLPRMVKQKRPDARVAIFWHIPWPNAEAFGICPWQKELLEGLLGADLIGFHTQSHCNNFMESVDRCLEARTDWDRFTINRNGHLTRVRPFPISVDFPEISPDSATRPSLEQERASLLANLDLKADIIAVGVDRVDYTKGILERFRAVERFLETWPAYVGRFSLIQIGAPSRTKITRYREFLEDVDRESRRINERFRTGRWKPIVLLKEHHSHEDIQRLYRIADLCLVTSLHDGMNLVAKEFIAAREDERGVLILSTFTGAARELSDALLVNPYDTKQVADAIRFAVDMPEHDQTVRMRRMRRLVREHNVYRWANDLLLDLCEIQTESQENVEAR